MSPIPPFQWPIHLLTTYLLNTGLNKESTTRKANKESKRQT